MGGVCVRQKILEMYSRILNYNIMKMPFKYLRVMLGENPKKRAFWQQVVQKSQKKPA